MQPETQEAPGTEVEETATEDTSKDQLAKARQEAAKYRTRARDAEAQAAKWREHEEANKSEIQKANDRAAAAEARVAQAELASQRAQVASAKGLPADLADLLTGNDKAEFEASADKLLAHIKPGGKTVPDLRPGPRGKPVNATGEDADVDAFIRKQWHER